MRAKVISVTRLVEMGELFKQFLKGYTLSEIEMLLARQLHRFQRCLLALEQRVAIGTPFSRFGERHTKFDFCYSGP